MPPTTFSNIQILQQYNHNINLLLGHKINNNICESQDRTTDNDFNECFEGHDFSGLAQSKTGALCSE